ncbi:MAG: leucyl aminopeptidase [Thermoplasmata archaeon]|nr:leucyl aminopeptidase [Thermoplasmata archaeon]
MKLLLDRREALQVASDAVLLGLAEGGKDAMLPPALAPEDKVVGGAIERAWAAKELRGKRREVTIVHRSDRAGRFVLVGLGARPLTAESLRVAAAEAAKRLRGKGIRTVSVALPTFTAGEVPAAVAVQAIAEGLTLGSYQYLQYKANNETSVEEATIGLGRVHGGEEGSLKRALAESTKLLDAVLWTRDLANAPPNIATPAWLAAQAETLTDLGLKVAVFDEKKLAELGCGGILAVGSGSRHPPRMVVVEWPGGSRKGRTVAIVGKGITFDSGGISIKAALGMQEMKFDKAGACAVLGTLRAAAVLKAPTRVVGILACAENLVGEGAYRPGDIVRTYSGKTIEVTNTDAEGRVVLSDALAYAVDKYHPDEIIDIATLTGAALTALGENIAAVVGNNERLENALVVCGTATGELLWRLPLTDTHREMVRSDVADVKNSVEPKIAGVLMGGTFLEQFVGETPWAHLDIAGPAYARLGTLKYCPPYQPLGATAFGVRLLTEYLLGESVAL